MWVLYFWLRLAEVFFAANGTWLHLMNFEVWVNLVIVNGFVLIYSVFVIREDWYLFFPREGGRSDDGEGGDGTNEAGDGIAADEIAPSDGDHGSILRFKEQPGEEEKELKVTLFTLKKHVRLSLVVHDLLAEGALGRELETFDPYNLKVESDTLSERRKACLDWFQEQECSRQLLELYPLNHLSDDKFWEDLERVVVGQDPVPTDEEGLFYDCHFTRTILASLVNGSPSGEADYKVSTLVLEARTIGAMRGINESLDEVSAATRLASETSLLLVLLQLFQYIKGADAAKKFPILVLSSKAREMLRLELDLDRLPQQSVAGTCMKAVVLFHPSVLSTLKYALCSNWKDSNGKPVLSQTGSAERLTALRLLSATFCRGAMLFLGNRDTADQPGKPWLLLEDDRKGALCSAGEELPACKAAMHCLDRKNMSEDVLEHRVDRPHAQGFYQAVSSAYKTAWKTGAYLGILTEQGKIPKQVKRRLVVNDTDWLKSQVMIWKNDDRFTELKVPGFVLRYLLRRALAVDTEGPPPPPPPPRLELVTIGKQEPPAIAKEQEYAVLTPNQSKFKDAVVQFGNQSEQLLGFPSAEFIFPKVAPPPQVSTQLGLDRSRVLVENVGEAATFTSIQESQRQLLFAVPAVEMVATKALQFAKKNPEAKGLYTVFFVSKENFVGPGKQWPKLRRFCVHRDHVGQISGSSDWIGSGTTYTGRSAGSIYLDPNNPAEWLRKALPKRAGLCFVVLVQPFTNKLRLGWVDAALIDQLEESKPVRLSRPLQIKVPDAEWVQAPWKLRYKLHNMLACSDTLNAKYKVLVNSVLSIHRWDLKLLQEERVAKAAVLPAAALLFLFPGLQTDTLCEVLELNKLSLLPREQQVEDVNLCHGGKGHKRGSKESECNVVRTQWHRERLVSVKVLTEEAASPPRLEIAKLPAVSGAMPFEDRKCLLGVAWPTEEVPLAGRAERTAAKRTQVQRPQGNRFTALSNEDNDEDNDEDSEMMLVDQGGNEPSSGGFRDAAASWNESIQVALGQKQDKYRNRDKKAGNKTTSGNTRGKGDKQRKAGDYVTLQVIPKRCCYDQRRTELAAKEYGLFAEMENAANEGWGDEADSPVDDLFWNVASDFTSAVLGGKELVLAVQDLRRLGREKCRATLETDGQDPVINMADACLTLGTAVQGLVDGGDDDGADRNAMLKKLNVVEAFAFSSLEAPLSVVAGDAGPLSANLEGDELVNGVLNSWLAKIREAIRVGFQVDEFLDFSFLINELRNAKRATPQKTLATKENDPWSVIFTRLTKFVREAFLAAFGKEMPQRKKKNLEDLLQTLEEACKKLGGGTTAIDAAIEARVKSLKEALEYVRKALESLPASKASDEDPGDALAQAATEELVPQPGAAANDSPTEDVQATPRINAAEDALKSALPVGSAQSGSGNSRHAQLVFDKEKRELFTRSGNRSGGPFQVPNSLATLGIDQMTFLDEIVELSRPNSPDSTESEVVLVEARFQVGELVQDLVKLAVRLERDRKKPDWNCHDFSQLCLGVGKKGAAIVLPLAAKGEKPEDPDAQNDWFVQHNHSWKMDSISGAVFKQRLLADGFKGTSVSPKMAQIDRRNILRDWNAAKRMPEQGRRAYAVYTTADMDDTTSSLALLGEDANLLSLEAQPKDRKVMVHGIRLVSRLDPAKNWKYNRDPTRSYVSTVQIKPLPINVPANQAVMFLELKVIFDEKVQKGNAKRPRAKQPRAKQPRTSVFRTKRKVRFQILLGYPEPPVVKKPASEASREQAEGQEPQVMMDLDSDESMKHLKRLGPHEKFGIDKELTLKKLKRPNLEVWYQDLCKDSQLLKKVEAAQKSAFPNGLAGKYKNPAFADPGLKRFLTLYAPLEKRVYYLGVGAGAELYNKVEKPRRKAQEKGCHQAQQSDFWRRKKRTVDKLHNAAVAFILATFDLFVLPEPLKGRGLGARNRWVLQHLAFGRFEDSLKRKAERAGGIDLLLRVSEAGTTIGCGNCGQPNRRIGNKEVHVCRCCGFKQARDGGAARSIALLVCLQEPDPDPKVRKGNKRAGGDSPTEAKRMKRGDGTPHPSSKNTTNNGVGGASGLRIR